MTQENYERIYLTPQLTRELETLRLQNKPITSLDLNWLIGICRYLGGFLFFGALLIGLCSNDWAPFLPVAAIAFFGSFLIPVEVPLGGGSKTKQIEAYLLVADLLADLKQNANRLDEKLNELQDIPDGINLLGRAVTQHIQNGQFLTSQHIITLTKHSQCSGNPILSAYRTKALRRQRGEVTVHCQPNQSILIGTQYGKPSPLYLRGLKGSLSAAEGYLRSYRNDCSLPGKWLDIDLEQLMVSCLTAYLSPDANQRTVDQARHVLISVFYPQRIEADGSKDDWSYASMDLVLLKLAVTKTNGINAVKASTSQVMHWIDKVNRSINSSDTLDFITQFASALCMLGLTDLEHEVLCRYSTGLRYPQAVKDRIAVLGKAQQPNQHPTCWVEHLPKPKNPSAILCDFKPLERRSSFVDRLFSELEAAGQKLQYRLVLRSKQITVSMPDASIAPSGSQLWDCVQMAAKNTSQAKRRQLQDIATDTTMPVVCLSQGNRVEVCLHTSYHAGQYVFTFYTLYNPSPADTLNQQHQYATALLMQHSGGLGLVESQLIHLLENGVDQYVSEQISQWQVNHHTQAQISSTSKPSSGQHLY